jgi:alkanesulfonate monooxygenase SsuD/methylene tetrahydromethanopterin reductase-like flavin-dependent oxidoreductase (luciferase family)
VKFLAGEGVSSNAREGTSSNGSPPGRRAIIGTPEKVRAGLDQLAIDYGADEVMVVTITHDHAARRRSYELLSEAMDLGRQSAHRISSH